jgi:hypothetical protein
MQKTVVELEGANGQWFTLAGPDSGDRGVYLATDVKGLFDPPVKTVYEEPGNWPGARYLNHRILKRDISFAVEILDDREDSWLSRESEWRKAWAFDKDCKLHITTDDSGTRTLKLRLQESPEVAWFNDPNGLSINRTVMVCVAGDPFWYENDVVYSVETTLDTRFDPGTYFETPDWAKMPKEQLYIDVSPSQRRGGLNPTDQPIFPKWTVPGSTEMIPNFEYPFPPGVEIPWERAPFVQWVLPDYSWEDDEHEDRRLRLPGLIYKENCVIDTDPRVEQVSSESGSQVWARMNGVRFRNPIPPWTKARKFHITVAGCIPGQTATLRLPRPWSRPWGLE